MMDNGVHGRWAALLWLAGIVLLALAACDAQAPLLAVPTLPVPTETPELTLTPTPTETPQPTPTATRVVIPSPAFSPTPYLPPAPEIVDLANAASLTDRARELFYAARPVIDPDRATLDRHCRRSTLAATVELGCFTPEGRIYILNINHKDLKNEMIVVAAHEMLHAAYAGISASEAATLTVQLDAAVGRLKDAQLQAALDTYSQLEPGQRSNELHSILGTEYAPLSRDIERYYAQYLKHQDVVVAAAQDFRNKFSNAPARIQVMQDDLNQLKARMDDLKQSNKPKQYNALIESYNAKVKAYNAAIKQYNEYSQAIFGK